MNEAQPFYLDAGLADRVRALLNSSAADFTAAAEYLPDVQALAWLVSSIDSGFTTDDLNHLVDAASASGDKPACCTWWKTSRASFREPGQASGSTPAALLPLRLRHDRRGADRLPVGAGAAEPGQRRRRADLDECAAQTGAAGMAYRYALSELNVFVLVGADYSGFNANGELDLYDEATGHGTFTAEYLADRPELLAAMVQTNLADIAPDASGTTVVPGLSTHVSWTATRACGSPARRPAGLVLFDGDTGGTITGTDGDDHLYGEGGDDVIVAGAGNDVLDGGEGNDNLSGGDGDDTVLGGAGSDTLTGGVGKDLLRGGAGDDLMIGDGDGDVLEGGTGMDTYQVRQGDVIRDEDGQGSINFGDAARRRPRSSPAGPQSDEGSLFVSDGGGVVYRQNDDGSIDFWVDGQRVTVLPGADDGGPRRRRDDGAPQEDQGGGGSWSAASRCWGCRCVKAARRCDPSYKTPFMLAQAVPAPRRDPLVLDLDGDGIETLGQQAVTYFDHDANGFAELTGWVKGDDGFLALDRNGDGRINDGRELFGDHTVLASGAVAANGVQALSEWDLVANGGNGDGVISASDAVWASLRVWRDVDADGFSDSGELFSPERSGHQVRSTSASPPPAPATGWGTPSSARAASRATTARPGRSANTFWRETPPSASPNPPSRSSEDVAALPEVRGSGQRLRPAAGDGAGCRPAGPGGCLRAGG